MLLFRCCLLYHCAEFRSLSGDHVGSGTYFTVGNRIRGKNRGLDVDVDDITSKLKRLQKATWVFPISIVFNVPPINTFK